MAAKPLLPRGELCIHLKSSNSSPHPQSVLNVLQTFEDGVLFARYPVPDKVSGLGQHHWDLTPAAQWWHVRPIEHVGGTKEFPAR